MLQESDIILSEDHFLLTSLTRACRIKNDKIRVKLPIRKDLLQLILKQIGKHFLDKEQVYLMRLFQALFATTYYGLFRIGEVTQGPHIVLAKNVQVAINKKKMLFILWTSKTHCKGNKPQLVKITSQDAHLGNKTTEAKTQKWCPFDLIKTYLKFRPTRLKDDEQFFVFLDNSPV